MNNHRKKLSVSFKPSRYGLTVLLGLLIGIAAGCASLLPASADPDAAIQQQLPKAGLALMKVPGDFETNYFKDLKGDQVPVEVRELERLLRGNRIKAVQQLVHYLYGAKDLKEQEDRETRGWASLTLAAYFNFTSEEIETAIARMSSPNELRAVKKELLLVAQTNHPGSTNAPPMRVRTDK